MLLLTQGNALRIPLADESVHCVVTSPPYYSLRDYGIPGQLGMEASLEEYVENMVMVFREAKRVMRHDAVLFLNLGDSYVGGGRGGNAPEKHHDHSKGIRAGSTGLKPKDLMGVPWRVAFALQADGWWLRSDIIWSKPNPMPESVTDRPTKAHEYLFLLTKSARYFYDADAVREKASYDGRHDTLMKGGVKFDETWGGRGHERWPNKTEDGVRGRNRRTVWHIATAPYSGAHFATYPPALVEPCIKAGTSEHGVCPECGNPWERVVERQNESNWEFRKSKGAIGGAMHEGSKQQIGSGWSHDLPTRDNVTLGWRPTCGCGIDVHGNWFETREPKKPVPATVFDPFAGSGTTLQVARALGRNGVGLDLSLEYLHLARQRLSLDALDAWSQGCGQNGDEKDNEPHKNMSIQGQKPHSMHKARVRGGQTNDLPLFREGK